MAKAQAYHEERKARADSEAEIIRKKAQARLETANNKSRALMIEAQAEANNSGYMEGHRRHTEKMEMTDALKTLAYNGHIVVSGKTGQDVLNYYSSTLERVAKR